MKKTICKVEYDTTTASLVKKVTFGAWGDPAGYEESLYVTESGKYFLYVNGGTDSKHQKEDITRMSAEKKTAWLAANA